MSNIERYFYLIVFAMYVRDVGAKGFPQTFQQFMDANSQLRLVVLVPKTKINDELYIFTLNVYDFGFDH